MCGGESDPLAWTVCRRDATPLTDEVLWCKESANASTDVADAISSSGTRLSAVRGAESLLKSLSTNEIFVLKQKVKPKETHTVG